MATLFHSSKGRWFALNHQGLHMDFAPYPLAINGTTIEGCKSYKSYNGSNLCRLKALCRVGKLEQTWRTYEF